VGVFDAHVIPAPYSKPPNSTLEGILAIRLQALQEARRIQEARGQLPFDDPQLVTGYNPGY